MVNKGSSGGKQLPNNSLNPCKKRKIDRINNIIFKDIKEFNIIFLILIGMFLVSISGYSSYAIFSDEIVSDNEIKGVVKNKSLDKSGANIPVLTNNMIPVYYDVSDGNWKKADSTNANKSYQWYNYDDKMWANSVTVSNTNRATYLSASPGTTIPMDDILTMQVWIPRYKYKVWNYNADGTVDSNPQEIKVTFENGTRTTGEIECVDNIQPMGGDGTSETCKLKSTNATCTDATCNNKTYTHPAFTFGDKELKGIWVGKFELTGTTDIITTAATTTATITTKPNLKSLTNANVSTFEANIMSMNDNGNIYGFSTNDDTHMIKNMEWGAVAYLSHSKYGTCTNGTCKEVNMNNNGELLTGSSSGETNPQEVSNGKYMYNDIHEPETVLSVSGGTSITPEVSNSETPAWKVNDGVYSSQTQGKSGTTTNVSFNFTAPSDNTYLSFDWSVSCIESGASLYYTITKDGTALPDTGTSIAISGTSYGTEESTLNYLNVTRQLEAGEYVLTFTYKKGFLSNAGLDAGYVKNIKILDSPEVKETLIGNGKDGPSASTTHNIYGIYDMNGGSYELVMGNIVSKYNTTMMSGTDDDQPLNSGYTGVIYDTGKYASYIGKDYPEVKYYDKYSFGENDTETTKGEIEITRSKLGDAIKEVYNNTAGTGWYDDSNLIACYNAPWLHRGGGYNDSSYASVFSSHHYSGRADSVSSSRLVIIP